MSSCLICVCVLPLAHGIPLYASQLSFRSVPEAGTNTTPGPLFGYSPECIDPYLAHPFTVCSGSDSPAPFVLVLLPCCFWHPLFSFPFYSFPSSLICCRGFKAIAISTLCCVPSPLLPTCTAELLRSIFKQLFGFLFSQVSQ